VKNGLQGSQQKGGQGLKGLVTQAAWLTTLSTVLSTGRACRGKKLDIKICEEHILTCLADRVVLC